MNKNTNKNNKSIADYKRENRNKNRTSGLEVVLFMMISMALPIGYIMYRENVINKDINTTVTKSITIEVINSAEETTSYEVDTEAQYLRQAMEEAEGLEFSGTEGQYGMVLTTVNGEVADYNENDAYWSITVNGEYGNYGIDQQPITDGDEYQIVYTPANE